MPARKRVSDKALTEAYNRLGNVHLVGKELGIHGASVHERLVKMGVQRKLNRFTDDDAQRLLKDYVVYRNHGRLKDLAASMGRTVPFISRKARELGLTDTHSPKLYAPWKYMTAEAARVLMDDFKASSLGMMDFCRRHGYSDDGFRVLRDFFPDEWDHVIEAKVPQQTMYRRGREFEYRVRDHLREEGYFVLRAPASRSPVDLVAIKPGQVLMIQCKLGGALPPSEWNELYDLACSCGAVPILAERPWPRKLRYWRMTGRKDFSRRTQPREEFLTDEVAAG